MEHKHTPGPWEWIGKDGEAWGYDELSPCVIMGTVEGKILVDLADARLIAAAPELLAALISAEKELRALHLQAEWENGACKTEEEIEASKYWPDEVYEARVAITKATGQES